MQNSKRQRSRLVGEEDAAHLATAELSVQAISVAEVSRRCYR